LAHRSLTCVDRRNVRRPVGYDRAVLKRLESNVTNKKSAGANVDGPKFLWGVRHQCGQRRTPNCLSGSAYSDLTEQPPANCLAVRSRKNL
jgi:hypothetical protein